jgi:hypothetical protein
LADAYHANTIERCVAASPFFKTIKSDLTQSPTIANLSPQFRLPTYLIEQERRVWG